MTVGHGSPQVLLSSSPVAIGIHWRSLLRAALVLMAGMLTSNANFGFSQSSSVNEEPLSAEPQSAEIRSQEVSTTSSDSNQSPSEMLAIELRIVWGGGTPRSFQGDIAIDNGSLKLIRNLSLQSDSIGSVIGSGNSTLRVGGHSASTFGGVDVMIEGNANSRITTRFIHPTTNQPMENSFALSEVLNERWLRKLDDQGSRIAAERQMQDRLRVRSSQQRGIFPSGSNWQGSLSGYQCGLPAGDYQLLTKLLDQSKQDAVVSEREQTVTIDQRGSFSATSLDVELPELEGSYAIEFSLVRKRFLQPFVSSTEPLTRRVDLVVFDFAAPPKHIEYWAPVATIEPLNSQWWSGMNWFSTLSSTQSLVQLPPFSEHSKRTVSHGSQSVRKVGEEDCLTLSPNAWQAYPLTIEHPGQPHRLRIRIPRDRAQQLAISIRDYHASGEPTTLNVDSGIVLTERQVATQAIGAGLWADHEVIFWPRSQQPMLLMFNPSTSEEAAFGHLQIEVGQIQLVSPPNTIRQKSTEIKSGDSRMVALYMTKPLMADAFGAQRNIDPITKRALDSWQTWQQSAERLSLYMQNAGYNTLVLNVAGDGGAVLPLTRLASTTRFDSGPFFSDGRSPEIKDFVELLCDHLDRAGLKLILSIDLNSHLPGLAKSEENVAKNPGLLQTNLEGKSWQLDSEAKNRQVLYNPLNPHVQTELDQIVREISNRYASHSCFQGLSFELSEGSHLVFAGDRWGYDEASLKQFEVATDSRIPTRESLAMTMQGSLRLAYLNWRARELSTFYGRLANTIRSAKSDAKLLLNPVGLWQRQPSQHDYFDTVAASRNLTDVMLAAGVDAAWLKQQQHVALLRGQSDIVLGSDLERAWSSRVANDTGIIYASSGNSSGTVQLQRPVGIIIPEANKLNGPSSQGNGQLSPPSSPAWCYPIAASVGSHVRRAFIEQLFREDSLMIADGTWMPQQSDSMQLNELRRTLVQLPNAPMQAAKIDRDENNLRVRSLKVGNDTFIQLINNAAWTERVTMDLKIADIRGVYEVLGDRDLQIKGAAASNQSSSRVDANGARVSTIWQFDVPPYDLIAFKISDPQFKLNSFIHSPDPSLIEGMKREVEGLEKTLNQISDLARAESLNVPGGDFENWVDGSRPSGWTVSSLPQVTIARETSLPHSGSSCVVLENLNQAQVSAWMQSEQIRIPESGRLVVTAWVRTPSVARQSQVLRLSLIGRTRDGRRYQRSLQFGTQTSGTDVAFDWGKRPVTLFVTDLPSAELVDLNVAFDLVGPGKVWVDDIQAMEAYLSPEERVQIRGQIFLAKEKLRENNAFPAEQLLNSHLANYLASIAPKAPGQTQANLQQTVTPEKPTSGSRWNNSPPILQQLRESMRERWQK